MPKAGPCFARHASADSLLDSPEDSSAPAAPAHASSVSVTELPSEQILSLSFNVSQLLAGIDELMSLYEAMVEDRCRGGKDGQEQARDADAEESKQQCGALHTLALRGMLPQQLARVYVGKPVESCPLEDWRSTGCPGLQPDELLVVIDQLMQVYETMVKKSVREFEPQAQKDGKLDSSIESVEKFKRLHRARTSRGCSHKPDVNSDQLKNVSHSASTSTMRCPSMLLEPADIARALSTPCDHREITEEAVLPLTACAQLPCRDMISVRDKIALWNARQSSESEPDLSHDVVRTISNSEMSGSSPECGSQRPAQRAPTPPWEGCPLEDLSSERREIPDVAFSLAHMVASSRNSHRRCQPAPDARALETPNVTQVPHRCSGDNSSAGSSSSSTGKMMQHVLQKLAQVELSLAKERESTQELAAKYENLLASREEAHSADVKLLEGMLATALKNRRHRAVGSTESGGTSSKRSQSRTLSSSAVSSSTSSRYGTKSACSRTPTSGSNSQAASQESPSCANSPELCAREPSPKESLGKSDVLDCAALGPASAALETLHHRSVAASSQQTLETPQMIGALKSNPGSQEGNDDLLKQFADAAWASRYLGLLPVAALGAILNDLLEPAPTQTPRPTPRS